MLLPDLASALFEGSKNRNSWRVLCVKVLRVKSLHGSTRLEHVCNTAAKLVASPAPGLAALFGIGCTPHSQQLSATLYNMTSMLKVLDPALCTTQPVPALMYARRQTRVDSDCEQQPGFIAHKRQSFKGQEWAGMAAIISIHTASMCSAWFDMAQTCLTAFVYVSANQIRQRRSNQAVTAFLHILN